MATRTLTRSEAIALLREKCLSLVDEEHSLCEVAARLHVLCGGFAQWRSHELKQRLDWIARRRPGITRKELERLANRWLLARQEASGSPLACDLMLREKSHPMCHGWNEFADEDLARSLKELTGEETAVVPDPVVAGG